MTRLFGPDEFVRFLQAVDRHLSKPRRIVVIGGAAAALAYGISRVTRDIDTIGNVADIADALRAARSETQLDVPFDAVGVYDAPYQFEDRLTPLDLGLERLGVVVPEKHDLVLMKITRGQENDLDAAEQIFRRVGLDQRVLVNRFKTEMSHVIGRPAALRANFLSLIEHLYGEAEADRVAASIFR